MLAVCCYISELRKGKERKGTRGSDKATAEAPAEYMVIIITAWMVIIITAWMVIIITAWMVIIITAWWEWMQLSRSGESWDTYIHTDIYTDIHTDSLLSYPMLSHPMPCHAILSHPMPCHPIPSHPMPCHAITICVMSIFDSLPLLFSFLLFSSLPFFSYLVWSA